MLSDIKIPIWSKFKIDNMLIFVTILSVYYFWGLKIHTWESYFYSDALEGFLDIRDVFLMGSPKSAIALENFDAFKYYHPNHPLMHLIVFWIYNLFSYFNYTLDTLAISSFINSFCGALGSLFFYRLLEDMKIRKPLAVGGLILLSFSSLYWYQSLSGEVYIIPILFLILSIKKMFSYIRDRNNLDFILTLFFFSLSFSFHFMASLFSMPFFLGLILIKKHDISFSLRKHLMLSVFVTATFFILVYVLPIMLMLDNKNFKNFLGVFVIYKEQFGAWNNNIFSLGGMFKSLGTSFRYFSGSFIFSGFFVFIGKIYGLLAIVISILSIKSNDVGKKILSLSFIIYYLFITFFLNLPNVIDYWIFTLIPALILLISFINKLNVKVSYVFIGLSIFVLVSNFVFEIHPKSSLDSNQYFMANRIEDNLYDNSQYVVISNDPYLPKFLRQSWHLFRKYRHKGLIFINGPIEQFEVKQILTILSQNKEISLFTDLDSPSLKIYMKSLIEKRKILITEKKSYLVKESDELIKLSVGKANDIRSWKLRHYVLSF